MRRDLNKKSFSENLCLKKHNFVYNDLVMLDLPSKEERIRLKAHGKFKAEVYKNRKETLFIESDSKQSEEIFQKTDGGVICINTGKSLNIQYPPDREINYYKVELEKKDEVISRLKKSWSYRIGRCFTKTIELLLNLFKKLKRGKK